MQIKIAQTDYTPDAGSIITAHWHASKTDGEYIASGYGADSFSPDPDSPNFVPFDQLTEADVVGWLTDKEGWAEALEARLDADIERQKNPPVLHGLPWADAIKGEVAPYEPPPPPPPPTDEEVAVQVRRQRDSLLAQTDWTQLADVPQATKDLWDEYRQALRDVPQQEGFPHEVIWPDKPE